MLHILRTITGILELPERWLASYSNSGSNAYSFQLPRENQ